MTQRTKNNVRGFITGAILGGLALVWALAIGGCGTVSGIGRDLMQASDGIRDAMTQGGEK